MPAGFLPFLASVALYRWHRPPSNAAAAQRAGLSVSVHCPQHSGGLSQPECSKNSVTVTANENVDGQGKAVKVQWKAKESQ